MFKRLLCVSLVLACSLLPAIAKADQDHRGVFSFYELYWQRFMRIQEDYSYDFDLMYVDVSPMVIDGNCVVISKAGTVYYSLDDYEIYRYINTFYDETASSIKNVEYSLSCIVAISALEYDWIDEDAMRMINSASPSDPQSAFDNIYEIFNEVFRKTISSDRAYIDLDGVRRKVYSGAYDYYITYTPGESDSAGTYSIIAEIRKDTDAYRGRIREIVESRLDQYWGVEFLNVDYGNSTAYIEMSWIYDNTISVTQNSLRRFSDDLIITISEELPELSGANVSWKVPALIENGFIAEYIYEVVEGTVYIANMDGWLFDQSM